MTQPTRRFSVEIDECDGQIFGRVAENGEPAELEFAGWLGLLSAFGRLFECPPKLGNPESGAPTPKPEEQRT